MALTGTIKNVFCPKGFLWIRADDGTEDVFAHINGNAMLANGQFGVGDAVRYCLTWCHQKGKWKAIDAKLEPSKAETLEFAEFLKFRRLFNWDFTIFETILSN